MDHNIISGRTAVKISDSIEDGIVSGCLHPGNRLPTIRALADQLRVNRNTVTTAYQRLAAAGLVVSDGRRGTRIAAAPPLSPVVGSQPPAAHVRRLDVGGPDPAFIPDLGPVLAGLSPTARNYGEETSLRELVEIGRRYYAKDGFRGGRLAIASGALDCLERMLRVHLRPGDPVGMEDPGFLAGVALVRSLGFTPVPIAVDDEGPVPDSLRRALDRRIRAVILTPRAQNPLGATIPPGRAIALRELLSSHPQLMVVEDDHAGPIAGAPAISVAYGHSGPWAIIRSVCKFLGPDLRLGFILGDDGTIARMEGQMALGMRWVSHLLQHVVVRLWRDRSVQRQIKQAARAYAVRRSALIESLAKRDIRAYGRSGLNVWVPVASEVTTVQALLDAGWAVAAGEGFRLESPPGIRITATTLEPEEAERLSNDLAGILSSARFTSAA